MTATMIRYGSDTAAAQQATGDARNQLAALEQAVRDGDDGVTPAALAEARHRVDHAVLREEAARARDAHRDHDNRVSAYQHAADLARQLRDTDDTAITAAYTDALAALTTLWNTVDTRAGQYHHTHAACSNAIGTANRHGERGELRDAGIHNAGGDGIATTGPDGRKFIGRVNPGHAIALVLTDLLDQTAAPHTGQRHWSTGWSPGVRAELAGYSRTAIRQWPQLHNATTCGDPAA